MRQDLAPSSAPLLEQLAAELVEATRTRTTVPPLRKRISGMDLDDAYAIQEHQLQYHLSQGRVLAGRKVGLTSLAMQQQLGVDSPDFGYFLEDMVYGSDAEIHVDQFIAPKVEPEFGFVLKENLSGPNVTVERAAAAIGEVYAAMEIIDSRVEDWDIKLADTVADNASCGAIAVGSKPLDIPVDELVHTTCTLQLDGKSVGSGTGADVMGDPIAPLAWLSNVLGEQGVSLEAGQLILPGSFTAAQPVVAGTSATADFGPHGALTIHFL